MRTGIWTVIPADKASNSLDLSPFTCILELFNVGYQADLKFAFDPGDSLSFTSQDVFKFFHSQRLDLGFQGL